MIRYFLIDAPKSERLRASWAADVPQNRLRTVSCPVTTLHVPYERANDLALQVKHNKRDELMIWSWMDGWVVHSKLLEAFDSDRFTGYRTRPATVRFRDGYLSHDYFEPIVTGWAGVARPESGIRLIEGPCPGCLRKKYSPFDSLDELIDWNQWSQDDFFMLWPFPQLTLITERVAESGYEAEEQMPTDACQYFYECRNCRSLLKPKPGDCCVFCSHGSRPCPPKLGSGLA